MPKRFTSRTATRSHINLQIRVIIIINASGHIIAYVIETIASNPGACGSSSTPYLRCQPKELIQNISCAHPQTMQEPPPALTNFEKFSAYNRDYIYDKLEEFIIDQKITQPDLAKY